MLSISLRTTGRLLAVALAIGSAAVQAANGISITRSQERAVRIGMNAAEVQHVLGRPAGVSKFRNAPGPIWRYHLVEAYGAIEFDVDFGSDGRVISARERLLLRN